MKRIVFLAATLLGGCVLTLESVVPEPSATFDQRLVGTWREPDGDQAVITKADGNSYSLAYTTSKGKKGTFGARLGLVGKRQVIDIWPDPESHDALEPYASMLIGAHLQFVLTVTGDSIITRGIERQRLDSAIKQGRVRLDARHSGDQLLLVDSSTALRAALGTLLADDKLLGDATVWRRRRR